MSDLDKKKTLELIQRMKLAKIGEYSKWESLTKKLNQGMELNAEELGYFSSFTRIYKDIKITPRSKIFHIKLSEHDKKPPCKQCGEESLFYCNMNDEYYCTIHIIGHDENEL